MVLENKEKKILHDYDKIVCSCDFHVALTCYNKSLWLQTSAVTVNIVSVCKTWMKTKPLTTFEEDLSEIFHRSCRTPWDKKKNTKIVYFPKSHLPHNKGNYDVELQLPVWSGKGLGTCSQQVVRQRRIQDKHKLWASTGDQLQLADHTRRSEIRCKPVRTGRKKKEENSLSQDTNLLLTTEQYITLKFTHCFVIATICHECR